MKHIDYRIRIDYDNIGGLNVPKGQRVMYGSLMVWMEHVDICRIRIGCDDKNTRYCGTNKRVKIYYKKIHHISIMLFNAIHLRYVPTTDAQASL